ncbi:hypothetical protein HJO_05880 [Hyphomonas johnsonii MHS-2]|uniref:Spore coat protein U domain-containing protein n=2 Tax=Hyphomonas johnsonii TaxID=81031 RepID=A0A059FS63_9PROT|nr:hypothetical protein HJO_05880 [Hyphomonas johnsonii MHS-2]
MMAAGALLAGTAIAECDVDLSAPSQVWFSGESNGYDGLDSTRFETRFSVQLTNKSDGPCRGRLSFQHPTGQAGLELDGNELAYSLSQSNSRTSVLDIETNNTAPANAIPIFLGPNQRASRSFSLSIPPRQLRPSGVYTEAVLVRLFDDETNESVAETTALLAANVRPQASILVYDGPLARGAITSGGSQHRIVDLGNLEEGDEASVNLLVQSNDGFDVIVNSHNAGYLVHDVFGADQRIAYSAFLDRHALHLSGGDIRIAGKGPTAISGSVMNFRVRIGKVGTARAGRYEDLITISVLPD